MHLPPDQLTKKKNDHALYCKNCFTEKFAPQCAQCERPIADGKVVSALNETYHEACFRCKACGAKLPGGRFHSAPAHGTSPAVAPLCKKCFVAKAGPTCDECGKEFEVDHSRRTGRGRIWLWGRDS